MAMWLHDNEPDAIRECESWAEAQEQLIHWIEWQIETWIIGNTNSEGVDELREALKNIP